ncbi:hypothetical protein [Prochlorococcus sp. MIT 1341]|uniref:hypothetical protein n=1 Tax=Prochlorococcus sp. MIT 1341 TaxID=3096221 RepID=UPI002A750E4F|nr:hypothetical protein [Prochlorococcus sp. MIT 1341]
MNSKDNCILISQVWLTEDRYKFKMMLEMSARKCRELNPDSYIIISGSGTYPSKKTIDACDSIIWNDVNREFPGNGFPEMIYKGILHAKEKGFERIFKYRGDSVILRENICKYCQKVLKDENKLLLISQESAMHQWLGDMVLFGETNVLEALFNPEFWTISPYLSGNAVLGKRYKEVLKINPSMNWITALRAYCSFRDIPKFKWVDLRYNFEEIPSLDILNNLEITQQRKFYWGYKQTVHIFDDKDRPITNKTKWLVNWIYEYSFYNYSGQYKSFYCYFRKYFLLNIHKILPVIRTIIKVFRIKELKKLVTNK